MERGALQESQENCEQSSAAAQIVEWHKTFYVNTDCSISGTVLHRASYTGPHHIHLMGLLVSALGAKTAPFLEKSLLHLMAYKVQKGVAFL